MSSRLGVSADAIEVDPDIDLFAMARIARTARVPGVRRGAVLHDGPGATSWRDASTTSTSTSTRSASSPISAACCSTATKRLLEVADERVAMQVEARCWCGARATHNARLVNGKVVYEGDVVVVGDTDGDAGNHCSATWSATNCCAAATGKPACRDAAYR